MVPFFMQTDPFKQFEAVLEHDKKSYIVGTIKATASRDGKLVCEMEIEPKRDRLFWKDGVYRFKVDDDVSFFELRPGHEVAVCPVFTDNGLNGYSKFANLTLRRFYRA